MSTFGLMATVPGPLVGPAEIQAMLGGVSRSRFRQIALMNPAFPQPFQTLIAGSVWLRADVERFIAEHRPHQATSQDDE